MRALELLRDLADDGCARSIRETSELAQVLLEQLERAGAFGRRADQQCTLDRRGDGDQFA